MKFTNHLVITLCLLYLLSTGNIAEGAQQKVRIELPYLATNRPADWRDEMTVLDEYRGLKINGTWTDTDPDTWDVFVRSELGLGDAGALPGMTLHLMGLSEVEHDRGEVLTYQASNPTSDVYGIRIEQEPRITINNVRIIAWGYMVLGPPSSVTKGSIYTGAIGSWWRAWRDTNDTTMTEDTLNSRIDDAVNSSLAHEIGHGVHTDHCPDTVHPNCYMWPKTDSEDRHVTQFASHHNQDYDIKYPTIFPPRTPPANSAFPDRYWDGSLLRTRSNSSSGTTTTPQ